MINQAGMKMHSKMMNKIWKGLVVCLVLASSCQKAEDGLNSMVWRLNFDLISTTWDIQFIDAESGEMIGSVEDDRIEVRISGTDADHILDLAGKRRDRYYSTYGFLSLALHPDRAEPQTGNPVSFMVHAHHPDYIPVSFPVFSFHDGIVPVKILMTGINNSPGHVGVLSIDSVSKATNGRIQDSVELYTPMNKASLQIAKSTLMRDANGAELGGPLSVTLGYFEGGYVESLRAMPGGQLAIKEEGSDQSGQIYSAGAFYLNINDAYNKVAHNFEEALELTLLINNDVYNPVTQNKISPLDMLTVWYQNDDTGEWNIDNTITPMAFQNQLLAKLPIHQSGLFMLGWIHEDVCPEPITLQFNTLPEYSVLPYAFGVNIYQVINEEFQFIRHTSIGNKVDQPSSIFGLPLNLELIFRFEEYVNGTPTYYRVPDPLLLASSCTSEALDHDLLPKTAGSLKQVRVVFIDTQRNNTRYTPKVFPGYYRLPGAQFWQSAFVYEGMTYLVNVEEGVTYELGINYKGEFHKKEVTIGPGEILDIEIEID